MFSSEVGQWPENHLENVQMVQIMFDSQEIKL